MPSSFKDSPPAERLRLATPQGVLNVNQEQLLAELAETWQALAGLSSITTPFGRTGINLESISSRGAELLSRATAGLEREDWKAASIWLRDREAAIAQVQMQFQYLQYQLEHGKLDQAIECVQRLMGVLHQTELQAPLAELRDRLVQSLGNPPSPFA
ncbi:hypothetical protein [Aureliella helgolandensis]|uniref:Uncharacterized protein n=1 Tax=Aureliella helgolandensis TaxID=2527968 RepID=A0A518G9U0_9BACT|nr:hypothetical protein [Aureliella helgolandensis]QDV25351.1 hypothetical protein Q31a_36760 [Aureliella helgolandensis]